MTTESLDLTQFRLEKLQRQADEMDACGWIDDAATIRALIAHYNATKPKEGAPE